MIRYNIKPITESSWILQKDGEKVAVVSSTKDGITILGNIPKKKHASLNELITYLGNDVTFEQATEAKPEKEAGEVDGYPIKHDIWYDVEQKPIPSYTRTQKSETRYAAGYFALKFANGWSTSFCPKLATLKDYEFLGPFKTKLEMQNSISQKNTSTNV